MRQSDWTTIVPKQHRQETLPAYCNMSSRMSPTSYDVIMTSLYSIDCSERDLHGLSSITWPLLLEAQLALWTQIPFLKHKCLLKRLLQIVIQAFILWLLLSLGHNKCILRSSYFSRFPKKYKIVSLYHFLHPPSQVHFMWNILPL